MPQVRRSKQPWDVRAAVDAGERIDLVPEVNPTGASPAEAPAVAFAEAPRDWVALRAALPEPCRRLLLDYIDLPARIVNHAARQGWLTLGDLADRSHAELLAERHLGRLSVHQMFGAVRAHLARVGV